MKISICIFVFFYGSFLNAKTGENIKPVITLPIKLLIGVDTQKEEKLRKRVALNIEVLNNTWALCGIQFNLVTVESIDLTARGLPATFEDFFEAWVNGFQNLPEGDGNFLEAKLITALIIRDKTKMRMERFKSAFGSRIEGMFVELNIPDRLLVVERETSFIDLTTTLSHEIGHSLGLSHVDEDPKDLRNLMYPNMTWARDLTREQCLQARKNTQNLK